MAFNFIAKQEDIFKILMSEREKARISTEATRDSFEVLDEIKKKEKTILPTTIETLDEYYRTKGANKLLEYILVADELYIICNQFLSFATVTHEEMEKLNRQISIRFKMYMDYPLTQREKDEYIPFEMQDLNEMLRYIYVWDIDHALMPRMRWMDGTKLFDSNFGKEGVMELCEKEGHGGYVRSVREKFKEATKQATDWMNNTFFKHWEILAYNMEQLNTVMEYTPIHSCDYDDGSRAPIGYPEDKQYYGKCYGEMAEEYRNKIRKQRSQEQGREM